VLSAFGTRSKKMTLDFQLCFNHFAPSYAEFATANITLRENHHIKFGKRKNKEIAASGTGFTP